MMKQIFDVDAATFDEATVHSPNHHLHRHPKVQETRTHNHPDDEHRFFQSVAAALAGADQILVDQSHIDSYRRFVRLGVRGFDADLTSGSR